MEDDSLALSHREGSLVQPGQTKMMRTRNILPGELIRFANVDEHRPLADELARGGRSNLWK